ncbi:MAG: hypothetical protein ACYDCK_01950 [Thermoplasmatota archaeon]
MAKKPEKSLADLDAELAALDAELAAIEGRKTAPKERVKAPSASAPEPPPLPEEKPARKFPLFGKKKEDSRDPEPDSAPPTTEEKPARKFALPTFGKKNDDAPQEPRSADELAKRKFPLFGKKKENAPAGSPAPAIAPGADVRRDETLRTVMPPPRSPPARNMLPPAAPGEWKHEGRRWRHVLPEREPPKLVRKLDAAGNVLAEEAPRDDAPPAPELGEKRLLSGLGLLRRKARNGKGE